MSLCKQRQRLNRRSKCTTTEHAVNVMVIHMKIKADEQQFFLLRLKKTMSEIDLLLK